MIRPPPMLVSAGVCLLLLTWLMVESRGPPSEAYVFAQRDVARVSLGEAGLRAAVLESRAGLLRDDDVIDDQMRILQDSVAELHGQARVEPADAPLLDALVRTADADEAALEHFKTDNALLQNSVSYFEVLDSGLARTAGDTQLGSAVTWLGNAVLLLTGDTSGAAQVQMQARLADLEQVERTIPPGDRHDRIRLLLAHGRVLARLIPAVDDDLAALFRISTYDLRQDVRHSQDRRRHAEETRAANYRLALYLCAVLLAAILARVALNWRADQMLLRQRAELEYLIADLSTRLIAVFPEQFEQAAGEILARLGEGFGADRAYLVLAGPRPATHRWSRTDPAPGALAWPPGSPGAWPAHWPAAIVADAHAVDRPHGEVLHLSDLPTSPAPLAVARPELRDWCGIVLRHGSNRAGLLGFDLVHPTSPWPRGGAGMVRMAGEVVQGALDRHAAFAERRELEQRLGRANRLETVGAFASGIAHNINNVMGAVAGHVEMAAAIPTPDPAVTHHLGAIADATERAQELVTAILQFGTRGHADRRTLTAGALVEGAMSMLRVSCPPGIEIAVDLQAPDTELHGEVAHLQQVLVNLVRNACQAMPDPLPANARITVDAAGERAPAERRLSHDILPPGDYLRLAVSDNGVGMSPRVLSRIFEPFFTSRPGGTGLGLATAREVVHDHGGALDVRSREGHGTTFTVWLPIADTVRDPETTARGNGEPVLLLCADPSLLEQDEDTLAALCYEPVGFASLDDALREAAATPGRFAALLLDPGCSAEALACVRRFRDARILAPAILVATQGQSSAPAIPETAALGVAAILARPLRPANVAEALWRCVARVH